MTKPPLLKNLLEKTDAQRYEYLHAYTNLLLKKAKQGETEKIEKLLLHNYGFMETILMLAVDEEDTSPTQFLQQLYRSAIDYCDNRDLKYIFWLIDDISNIVESNPEQFASHLYERLLANPSDGTQDLLKSTKPYTYFWLKPLGENQFYSKRFRALMRFNNNISHLKISPDGKKQIAVSERTIQVLASHSAGAASFLVSERVKEHFKGEIIASNPATILDIATTPDSQELYSVCEGGVVSVWDLTTYLELHYFELWVQCPDIKEGVSGMVISGDGRYLYFSDGTGAIYQFDSSSCTPTGLKIPGYGHNIKKILYSDSEDAVIALDDKHNLRVWHPHGRKIEQIHNDLEKASFVSLSADGKLILIVEANKVCFFDIKTKQLVKEVVSSGIGSGFFGPVSLSEDRNKLYASDEGALIVIDVEREAEISRRTIHGPKLILRLAVASDEEFVILGDERGNVHLVEARNFNTTDSDLVPDHKPLVAGVAISSDGSLAISNGQDHKIIWQTEDMSQLAKIKHDDMFKNMSNVRLPKSIKMYGGFLLTLYPLDMQGGGFVEKLMIIKAAGWKTLNIFKTEYLREYITAFNATRNLSLVVFATKFSDQIGRDQYRVYCHLYKDAESRFISILPFHMYGEVVAIAVAEPPEIWVVIESTNPENFGRSLEIYNLERVEHSATLCEGKISGLDHLKITADFEKAVIADFDKIVVWDVTSRKQIHIIQTNSSIEDLHLSDNCRYIVSVGIDKKLSVWSLDTYQKVTDYIHQEDFCACAISSDGSTLLAGDLVGNVQGFSLEQGSLQGS